MFTMFDFLPHGFRLDAAQTRQGTLWRLAAHIAFTGPAVNRVGQHPDHTGSQRPRFVGIAGAPYDIHRRATERRNMGQPGIVADGKAGLAQHLPVRRHRPPGRTIHQLAQRILTELLGNGNLGCASYHQTGETCGVRQMSGQRCEPFHWPAPGHGHAARRQDPIRVGRRLDQGLDRPGPPRIELVANARRMRRGAVVCRLFPEVLYRALGTHGSR